MWPVFRVPRERERFVGAPPRQPKERHRGREDTHTQTQREKGVEGRVSEQAKTKKKCSKRQKVVDLLAVDGMALYLQRAPRQGNGARPHIAVHAPTAVVRLTDHGLTGF